MRVGKKGVTTLKRANTIILTILLVLGTFVLAATPPPGGNESESMPEWPSEEEWINYSFRGEPIRDWEDKPYENDPTHGIANVQPAAVDIASGVDASGGGEANNPGAYTSVQYLYIDNEGGITDDWLFLRMRVADDPRQKGGNAMYKSYHWDILLEVDGDIYSEFVVDLNGGDGDYKWGTIGVYYNNTEDYEYDPENDAIWTAEASKDSNDYTNASLITYNNGDEDDDQWWIAFRIPVIAFTDHENNQLLDEETEFLLFFSTSASLTNPLQKDWMGEYVFGEPANITVEKTVEEDIVSPGDVLHYKIYYNNTGEFKANDVWINDTIPEYTTVHSYYPDPVSTDGGIYTWHFTDVEPGNHSICLNVTVDSDVPDGTIIRNYVVLNYTDDHDEEKPGSEDETENPVEGPFVEFYKEADREFADPGDKIEYTLTYTNTGSGGAYNVVIIDTLPPEVEFDYSDPAPTGEVDNVLTWNIDVIPGSSTDSIIIYADVPAGTEDGTYLVNHASLDYEDVNENPFDLLEDWANITVTASSMTITKVADPDNADPGDEITYTITYENTGSGDAANVVIVDTLDPNTSLVSATPAPNENVGNVLTWNLGTVAGETSDTITIVVEVNEGTADGEVLNNTVTLDYTDPNDNSYPQESDYALVTVTAPVMTVEKVADKTQANPGDIITYTITYENTGSGNAAHVWVNDTIPDHTSYYDSDPDYTVSGSTYSWYFTNVAPGTYTVTLKVTVDVGTDPLTNLTNTVTLDYTDANGNQPYDTEEDSAYTIVTAPDMTIEKTADKDKANPGDIITYTLTYTNNGNGDAAHVWVNDTIPDHTTYYDSDPDYTVSGSTYSWHFTNVAPGTHTVTLKVTVDVGTDPLTNLTNTVTLDYTDANGNQPYGTQEDSAYTIVTAPDMSIEKVADLSEANPGDIITYTITYTNDGNGDAGDVWINDTIPDYTTYDDSNPTYHTKDGSTYKWHFEDLEPGTYTITLKVKVDVGTEPNTELVNTVTLDYTDANGNQPYGTQTATATTTVTAPSMTITKVADLDSANPGDIITYNITYKNLGNGIAANVWINDTISGDTTYEDSEPEYHTESGGVYRWHFTNVAPGTYYITLKVKVNVGVEPYTVLNNSVTLEYQDANENQPYDTETAYDTVTVTAPDMTISKEADLEYANPGDIITYTLTYTNVGNGDAAHVWINDTIPEHTTYYDSDPGYTVSGKTYSWHFTNVGPGTQTVTLKVTVDIGTAPTTNLTNTVTLDYTDANGNQPYSTQEDSDYTIVKAPDMTITKEADFDNYDPGDIITYTITYTNNGNGDAAHVWINDTIPDYTTYEDSNPTYHIKDGSTYKWHFTNVGPGDHTITLKVKVDVGTNPETELTNTVTMDYTDANGNQPYGTETAIEIVTVTAPSMTISKTADLSKANPGDIITYNITYKNLGNGVAAHVWINDTIPDNTTYEDSNPTYHTKDGSTYKWHFTNVDPGTYYITLKVKVDVGTNPFTTLTNTVTLDYTDANGNQPYGTQTDTATTTVTAPDISISKVADLKFANPGDTITYTITYINSGNGDAAHVWINDTIPDHTTYDDSNPTYHSKDGSTYKWHYTNVSPGTYTITLKVTVDIATDPTTNLTNTVTLDYTDANGNQPYPTQEDSDYTIVTAPDVSISKVADLKFANPGDTITYTITYVNSGNGNAAHVWINDTIPNYTTYEDSNPGYHTKSGSTYRWHYTNVAPGTYTITLKVKVDVGTDPTTNLTNTVTLDYTDANGNQPYPTQEDSDYTIVTAPDMTISKVSDVDSADPGDFIIYNITYKNLGNGIAAHVWINDTIPDYTTYEDSNPTYHTKSGSTYRWHFTNVAPGTYYITLKVVVDVAAPAFTALTNVVTLNYTDANENQPYDEESDTDTVTATAPDMIITKVANVTTADPGDIILYNITYKNLGNGIAAHVWINDTIPNFTTYEDSNPLYHTKSGSILRWHFTDIAPGTYYINIEVSVNSGTVDGTNLTNEVTLDYTDANENQPYPTQTAYAYVIVTAPAMSIFKTANVTTADPGDGILYTIEWVNNGNGNATNVVITDTLPDNVTLDYALPDTYTKVGKTLTWDLGTVEGNANGTIYIYVTVDIGTPDGTVLTNGVVLDYDDDNENPQDPEEDEAETTVTAPVMTFLKTANRSTANPGDTIIYTLTYNNIGSGNATGVTVTDTLSSHVTLVDTDPNHNSSSGTTYTWDIGFVPGYSGGVITITVTVNAAVPDGTLLVNVAVYSYDDDNGNPYDDITDYANVTVTAPIMTITKIANVTTADPSDYIEYTIEYKNIGTGNATDVVILDTIAAETTLFSATFGYSQDDDNFTWNFAIVEAGDSGTITIVVQVDAYTPDTTLLTNIVTLDYDDVNGNPYPQESDLANVTVTAPDMIIIKVANVPDADPGDTIIYTLTYINLGSGFATDILITDTIPADTTFVDSDPYFDVNSSDTYTWNNIISVAPYANGTITIEVTVDVAVIDGKVLHNTCTLDYDDANGNPYATETDFADVTVTAPDMTISKGANVTSADPSDQIAYTIEYENLGSGNATNIVIVDTIPLFTTLFSASPTPNMEVGRVLTWNISLVEGGGSGTITVVVTVNPYTADGVSLINSVTLDYDDDNGNPYPQEKACASTTVTAPVFTFSKVAGVIDADPGDPIEYTLSYSNIGSGWATDLVITDIIPENTTFDSSNPNYNASSGDTYKWFIDALAPGASGTIIITVIVDAGTSDGALLHNIGRFDYDDANGNPYPQKESTADVTVTVPILSITKTADVTHANPDDEITYTIVFTNSGTGNATNVWINDTIPVYTTHVSSTPGHDDQDGNTYIWFRAKVGAGESITITLVLKVNVSTPDKTVLHNGVTLDYSDDNGNPLDQETSGDNVTVTAPVFTFWKCAGVFVADPDDPIEYTIDYKNIGTGNATLVEIVDSIPDHTTFVSASETYSVSGRKYTWYIGDVLAGVSGSITITVKVNVSTADKTLLHNTVTLDYADANGNYYPTMNDYADVCVTAPVLSLCKVASVPDADPGDIIKYTIEYKNSGTGWASLVEIVDTIPEHTTFKNATSGYTISDRNYTWTIGNLGPGNSGTITINVSVDVPTPDGTLLHNVVVLDWADANGNLYTPLNDYADVYVTAPVLTITKVADVPDADPGDPIIYTITVKNWGTGPSKLVKVVDTIPDHTTFDDATAGYTVSGRNYTWLIGDLGAGLTKTITLKVIVNVSTPDKTLLYNYVTLDYADANENYYPQLDAYANVDVTAPVLSITKVANVPDANPGDIIKYTIEYENSGTGVAKLVEIIDTIPDHTTFLNATAGYTISDRNYTWTIGDVGPGGSGIIIINVTVDVPTTDTTLLYNKVTLDWADANENYYPQIWDYANVVVTAPILHMQKVVNEGYADPGDTLVYTIIYSNSGTGDASLVEILDTIPENTTFVSATAGYTPSGRNYTWVIGNLLSGKNGTITITVTVEIKTDDKKILHNVAKLDWADANGNYYPQLSDYADTVVTAPIMAFSKSTPTGTADPGDVLVYTITYKNIGTGLATQVKIEDDIPISYVTLLNATPMYNGVSGGTYIWNIGNVTSGGEGVITVIVIVDVGVADQTLLHNGATLYWADANGNFYTPLTDFANVFVTAPVFSMSKTADVGTADPDDLINYTIRYENSGTGWASLVTIVDTIPADTTFVTSTPWYNVSNGSTYIWTIGHVPPHNVSYVNITVKVNVPTPDETHLYNNASLDWADANGNYYLRLYDDADVYVTAPILSFSKTANNVTSYPTDLIVYTLTYENSGTGWASGVVVVDTISIHTTFVESNPGYTSESGLIVFTWEIGDVGPGKSGEITINATVKEDTWDTTQIINYATLDWADANGNPYDQLDDYANVTVTAPVMVLDKWADKTSVNPGDILTFTINYKNIGTGTMWGFVIEDTIPAFTTFVDSDPDHDSVSGNTYRWNIGRVNPGTDENILFIIKIDAYTPDQIVIENEIGNVSVEIPVTAPKMDVFKTADMDFADPGDLIVYTILFINNGTGNATGVFINDTIPDHTTFVSSDINYTQIVGSTYVYFIDFVHALSNNTLTITVRVDPGTADKTLLHNEVTLDYADVNGNYYDQEDDFADVTVKAPVMVMSKDADPTEGTPGDPIEYTIHYENTGTGNASNVVVVDTLPLDVTFVSATPLASKSGNILTWNIGDVLSGDSGTITVNVYITPGTWDQTVLTNVAKMDYSDANGNFIEQLSDSAQTVVIAPVMTIDKEAGEVTERAYITTDIRLRVAGEKWHDVNLTLFCNDIPIATAGVLRVPGDPDDQSVTIENVTINLLSDVFSALVVYTPFDDVVNGQFWGADPAWLILNTEYGNEIRLHHTFNVRHPDTWNWSIDDFRPYLTNLPLTLNYTVSYEIDYANIGIGDATNVWIYDEIPSDTFLVFSDPSFDSYIGNIVGWNIGYVPSGESGTIKVNISFLFENVIVKNWNPQGKILENTATMDYHDTNGNLVETISDTVEVTVYIPSELKKSKMTMYSPIFMGEGRDTPSELMDFAGFGTMVPQEKFLVFYEPHVIKYNLGLSSGLTMYDELTAIDHNVVHIYLAPYQFETAPPQEDSAEIPDVIPPQIDIPVIEVIVQPVHIEPVDIMALELGIMTQNPLEIIQVIEPITFVESESHELQQIEIVLPKIERSQTPGIEVDNAETVMIVNLDVVSEPLEKEVVSKVTVKDSTETVKSTSESVEMRLEETQNSATIEMAVESQIQAAVSLYLSLAQLVFALVAVALGLSCWLQRRKRR